MGTASRCDQGNQSYFSRYLGFPVWLRTKRNLFAPALPIKIFPKLGEEQIFPTVCLIDWNHTPRQNNPKCTKKIAINKWRKAQDNESIIQASAGLLCKVVFALGPSICPSPPTWPPLLNWFESCKWSRLPLALSESPLSPLPPTSLSLDLNWNCSPLERTPYCSWILKKFTAAKGLGKFHSRYRFKVGGLAWIY